MKTLVVKNAWMKYAASLIDSGIATEDSVALCCYESGANSIDSLLNIDGDPLPMVLLVDETERVLKMWTPDFVENPVEYKIRATLPLNKIVWATIRPVPEEPNDSSVLKSPVDISKASTSAPAKRTDYLLVLYLNGGVLIFSTPFFVGGTGKPEKAYYAFVHKLQTLSPFYSKEDGVEYFDVSL